MDQEKIGKFIQILRKDKNMTQSELAEKLGVSTNAVSKWERGLCLMDMSLLNPLSTVLDISITELLNGEKLNNNDIKNKSDEAINNTIDYSKKRIKNFKKRFIIIVLITILFLWFCISFTIDYKRVKNNQEPIFMVLINYDNKDKYTYLGFGYKMIKKASISISEPLSSSQNIRFGFWLFTWNVDVYNIRPYNMWAINDHQRILLNIGSYCITDDKDNYQKSSACGLSIPIEMMEYKDILNSKVKDVISLDRDVSITRVEFYTLDGTLIDRYNHGVNSFEVPELKGDYLVLIDTVSYRGTAWYSFRINIS